MPVSAFVGFSRLTTSRRIEVFLDGARWFLVAAQTQEQDWIIASQPALYGLLREDVRRQATGVPDCGTQEPLRDSSLACGGGTKMKELICPRHVPDAGSCHCAKAAGLQMNSQFLIQTSNAALQQERSQTTPPPLPFRQSHLGAFCGRLLQELELLEFGHEQVFRALPISVGEKEPCIFRKLGKELPQKGHDLDTAEIAGQVPY